MIWNIKYIQRANASLSVFYRQYHGECSEDFNLIPSAPYHNRTICAGFQRHGFTSISVRFLMSYLFRTVRLWNYLPASVFHPSYGIESFKHNVKYTYVGRDDSGTLQWIALILYCATSSWSATIKEWTFLKGLSVSSKVCKYIESKTVVDWL